MATIAENLQKIVDIKQDIKTAIENKGVDMTNTPFSEYSTKIDEITTGGGSGKIDVAATGLKFGSSTFTEIPDIFDFSNLTTMSNLFYNCEQLTTITMLDTSNVTNMSYMFYGCTSLQSIPLLDTANVTKMPSMFRGCSSLTTIPEINTSNVTDMGYMFYNCSSLTTIPQLDTSNVTNMGSMLYGCSKLVSLPKFNVPKVNAMNNMFGYSNIATLTDVGGWENLKLSWNDSNGLTRLPNLTYDSCINILNGLYDFLGNGETPDSAYGKLKVNSKFLTTVTEEDLATATAKGWTITA